ncbi:UNVERIFIED_CONTAM: Retrovirus-related Pol polyprotein from transposon opus [Sesamum latifolium]|uniref:Retrovirus-related Pol polyprotein from transposon opus n=1 Tax=Sesamum latifolium TaxID=2727402 RepID=A0AAW2U432_9LAMI
MVIQCCVGPKPGNKWRMCTDFCDINKACPKDFYLLPRIDQLVDSTSGHELLSLMDTSQGYHQIMLNPDDQKRVSFITSGGTYCYVVMPFGLKNAGATYQRLVDRMFKEQLGRNMEVYVDDMLVKSRQTDQHLADLAETFSMKLNPAKCAFGVRSGKFLGYLVKEKGIEVNPEKIRAMQEMKPPPT